MDPEPVILEKQHPLNSLILISNFLKINNYEFDEISKSIKTYANSGDCLELN